ncbi:hypothetical protein [Haladaptatus sp.]|uniref:DUF7856 family protein n=1 Tax=Haladaptatus sp. TaxID=1973141 RepID=UPI003C6A3516
MNVETESGTFRGRAIDLSGDSVAPEDIVTAVRSSTENGGISIICGDPGPIHRYIGCIESGMSIRPRPALAAAARSLGVNAPQDEEIAHIEERMYSLDIGDVSLRAERRRVADASGSETRLREQVAALRGRVQALREVGRDSDDAESDLQRMTRELAELETKRIAAEQTLEAARKRQQAARNAREQRLRLRDRKENLERSARRYLVRRIHEQFNSAIKAVPGQGQTNDPGTFEGDPVTAALAVARVARVRAPIVLACDRFDTSKDAAECLDAPVLQV